MRDHRGVREFLPPRATRGGGFRGRGGETHRAHDDDAMCHDGFTNGEKVSSFSERREKRIRGKRKRDETKMTKTTPRDKNASLLLIFGVGVLVFDVVKESRSREKR